MTTAAAERGEALSRWRAGFARGLAEGALCRCAGQQGLAFLTETQLKNLMSRAAMDHFQIAVHAIGDAANATMLNAVEALVETYKGDRRWRIEHAQIVDPADLPRFGRNGIIASMQPVHQTSDRLMAEARLGPARLAGAYAWASMLKAGAPLAFGSDTPVEKPDPFAGLSAAISRQGADGQPEGGWQPQERITREQALAAYTTGPPMQALPRALWPVGARPARRFHSGGHRSAKSHARRHRAHQSAAKLAERQADVAGAGGCGCAESSTEISG
jgi:predicted amidohydrolase YtcJ